MRTKFINFENKLPLINFQNKQSLCSIFFLHVLDYILSTVDWRQDTVLFNDLKIKLEIVYIQQIP